VDDFRRICDVMEDLQDIEKSLKLEFKMKSNANKLRLGLKLDKSDVVRLLSKTEIFGQAKTIAIKQVELY
jgi:hypothetical protein